MDRYRRIEKPKVEIPIEENEIRITSQGRMRNYITYAMSLLQDKGSNEIVFKAMGRAINKTVTIVELIKRRIIGIHQVTSICSTDITDNWEPIEEGLNPVETTRHVSMITIILSKKELNTSSIGYQAPLSADQVRTAPEFDYEGEESSPSGFRGRGRGGRGRGGRSRGGGNGFIAAAEYEDGGWDRNREGFGRGRGRGRGRGFHGRGRGGYDNNNNNGSPFDDNHQEPTFQGRGRGGYNDEPSFQQGGGGYNGRGNRGSGGGRGGYNDEPSFQQGGGGGYNGRGNRGSGGGRGGYNDEPSFQQGGGGGYNGRGNRGSGGGQFDNNNHQQGGDGYNREPSFQSSRGRGGGGYGGGGGGYNQEPNFQGRGRGRGRGWYRGGRGRGGSGFRSNGGMNHTAAGGA